MIIFFLSHPGSEGKDRSDLAGVRLSWAIVVNTQVSRAAGSVSAWKCRVRSL